MIFSNYGNYLYNSSYNTKIYLKNSVEEIDAARQANGH
jgi:hypothetical protein